MCIGDYEYIKLHYLLSGTADIGRLSESWSEAPWRGDPERLRQSLTDGGFEAVFVAGLMEDDPALVIDARYSVLTDDGQPLRPYSLYRVQTREDGTACLSYMATMTEEIE